MQDTDTQAIEVEAVEDPAPAPCRGACEQAFIAAIAALECEAGRLGFELLYVGLRHTRCGETRSSSTSRRKLAVLLTRY